MKLLASAFLGLLCSLGLCDPRVGKTWTPFQLSSSSGEVRQWSPGRVTLVSFCAYWCDTWKVQVPRLVAARNVTAGLPVDFITVSVDGRWAEVAKNNQGLPLWLDKGGEWSRGQGVDRVPTTVVLDASGEVRYVGGSVVRTEDIVGAIHSAFDGKPTAGTLYLTFDDFPPKDGVALLDALRALDVKATFFCMGSRVEPEAKLLRRALAEGHSLQMHSWDHEAANPQLARCREAFRRVLGFEPTLYRPPGSETIVGESQHHRIVDPFDYSRPSRKELLRRILPAVCDGAVIQLHAGVLVTLECLPELVSDLRNRGFQFSVLGMSEDNGTSRSSLFLQKGEGRVRDFLLSVKSPCRFGLP